MARGRDAALAWVVPLFCLCAMLTLGHVQGLSAALPEDMATLEAEAKLEQAARQNNAAEERSRGRMVISVIGGFTVLCMIMLSLRCFIFVSNRRHGTGQEPFSTMFRHFLGLGRDMGDEEKQKRFTPEDLCAITSDEQETCGTIWVYVNRSKHGSSEPSGEALMPVHWFRHAKGADDLQDPLKTHGVALMGGGEVARDPVTGEDIAVSLAVSVGVGEWAAGEGNDQGAPGGEPDGAGGDAGGGGGGGVVRIHVQEAGQRRVSTCSRQLSIVSRRLSTSTVGVQECCICLEEGASVRLFPCKHKAACQLCFMRTLQSWAHAYPPNCVLCSEAVKSVLLLDKPPKPLRDSSAHSRLRDYSAHSRLRDSSVRSRRKSTRCVLPDREPAQLEPAQLPSASQPPSAHQPLSASTPSDMRVMGVIGDFVFEIACDSEHGDRRNTSSRPAAAVQADATASPVIII